MRTIRSLLILMIAFLLCMGGSVALAAQTDQGKSEKPPAQKEETAPKPAAEQEKKKDESQQPQPANVPVIKKDEGC